MIDSVLLDLLVCPVCKGALVWKEKQQELVCLESKLAYPVKDGLPVMLESEARKLDEQELL